MASGSRAQSDADVPRDGLIVWLNAGDLRSLQDGAPINHWPAHGDTAISAEPSPHADAPTLVADAVAGQPAVAFDGVNTRLALPQLQIGHEFTLVAVTLDGPQLEGNSVHRSFLGATNDPYRKDGDGYGFDYFMRGREKTGTTVILGNGKNWEHLRNWWRIQPTGAFEVLAFRKAGRDIEALRSGRQVAERHFTRAADATYATGYDLGGISGHGPRHYKGRIAELLVYDRPLNDAALQAVQSYLGEKYNLPIADEPVLTSDDPRFFDNGSLIFQNGYCDQAYVVQTHDDAWLAVITTAAKEENDKDRHLKTFRSTDQGKTWQPAGELIEPTAEQRQPSWCSLYVTPFGRVYAFYNLNRPGSIAPDYVYRYSDDHGATWSDQRYEMPIRPTAFNTRFPRVQGWSIDDPASVDGKVVVAYSKFESAPDRHGEGWVFISDNLDTERDADKLNWAMYPEGDHGIRNDALGTLQEEHNTVPMSDGGLYVAFRTIQGYVGEAYSRDGGKTWSEPAFATYADGGHPIKHPRAAARVWRTSDGHYFMWTHNHDGRDVPPRNKDRNPGWLLGGVERNGRIHWSQPEVALFGFQFKHDSGMSYPDLIEEDGRFWLAATNKEAGRVFELDPTLVAGLIGDTAATPPLPEPTAQWRAGDGESVTPSAWPQVGDQQGFTVIADVVWPHPTGSSRVLVDARDDDGAGFVLRATGGSALEIGLNNGQFEIDQSWDTDPGLLKTGQRHEVAFVVDGSPRLIKVFVDGILQDGGKHRQFGWTPFSPKLTNLGEGSTIRIPEHANGPVQGLRLFDRPLRSHEIKALHETP